ncbi:SprT family zinc-dependent metalloprotease [Ignavibacteria bacterium]|nr:M48 family metallopeptidase [Bacteroidota bacterium]MCZ2132699.1 M48 family metallopeptidase [Bacteroidota bacterium]
MPAKSPLPPDVALIRRKVKRARIEIERGGDIRLIAPIRYSDSQIRELYYAKIRWIEKTRQKLAARERRLTEKPANQLLFLGQNFDVIVDRNLAGLAIDYVSRVIRTCEDVLSDTARRERWYKHEAEVIICGNVRRIAAKHGFSYGKITIRSQKSRWGSCSSNGNLSFNWRLVMAPPSIAEYLVCHELTHTVHHNHSTEFWRLVAHICPDYSIAESWLRENEAILLDM